METRPGEGVVKEKFPNNRKPSHWRVCRQFWNLRGRHNPEEKKTPTEYAPNCNSQRRSSPVAGTHLTPAIRGLDREAWAACFRVRTGPEYPEDNLRELTWDSNPNCGIAREEKKILSRERL